MTTLSHVELGVLGPLQVRQYGLPVAVPGAKPRAVLTMLGLHGGAVVTADALAELLWGARPPRTAVKALQTHISSLRRALGDGYVLTEGTGWTLSTTEIDATRYKLAARLGREAFASGDAAQAAARFDEALALWRGVPELPDGPRGGSEKTRWIEGHAALVEDRADALLATGRAAEIVGELEAAIADAPLRERRWGQLMLALYRAGRQGEALGAYQRARAMLADELGVDPGPDLRRLEAAIVAQDVALEIVVPEQLSVVTRAVTFLLTDIEGSTAAWEADADAMATALARHDEIVEQVVTSRGGRLVKTRGEGDATFSVFDRPSGAATAAIELQEAIRHEPWALAEPMRVRVALHTGEVELRDGDYFGRAVNRAARLRSLAQGGQILCSGATAELVIDTLSDDVVLADLGMRHLRNLARPEHVFELRLETAEDSIDQFAEALIQRPAIPAVLSGPGPFVGRGPELQGLLESWQTTLAGGTRAILIAGEPGVGKTRLAGEWSRLAFEQEAIVLYGRCDEDLGAAYQPFAEALRALVPCVGATGLRGLRGVEALLPLVPGLIDVVPDLSTPARSDPDTERYALFDAVVTLLVTASASAPIVLILDDLHWAAKPTLLLLRHLLRFGEHARVQIVGTYRSTDLDRSHPLAAMLADLHRDGSASRVALGGLDEDDVTAYVAEAGYDDVDLARALASVTGGNPFFLIEALRHVDESGGRWDPSTLPQGVREAVSRRLSRLPDETNKALAAAAVIGSRFPLALVEQVVGDDLVDAIDQASKAGIVIEEPGGRYRFNHALVRQSLLAELASVRRMRLHQKIATTLEADLGADDELLAELAYHYFECAWAGNAAKAVEYCRRAADQAIDRLAYEGAADLYDRALHALEELDDELPDRDAQQAELLVARCEALLAAGDVGSAAGAVAQLKRAAGDSMRLTAWGTCFDGQLSMLTDPERLDEIESEVNTAAQRLAELDDAAGEANAHTVRASCLARLGRIAECETALDQALTAARRARDHRRVNAVLAGAPLAALLGPNPVPRAGGRCLDVVRLLRITTGSPVVEATSTRCQGVLDAMRGRAGAGRQLIDSARRTLTELGMRHALLEVDQFAGIVELIADDPAAAEPHLRRAYDGFRRMGLEADTAEAAAFLARACLLLDRDSEADELCRESERLAGHALRPSITWRTVRALLYARGGAYGEARRVAEEAVKIAERTDALVDHGDACLTLGMVLAMAGDIATSRNAAEQAVALFERKGAAALVERARGIIPLESPPVPPAPETSAIEPENECVRVLRRVEDAVSRKAWSEVEQAHAPVGSIESRRKIVGFERMDLPASRMASGAEKFIRDMRAVRTRRPIVAVRGEHLALTRTVVGTADDTPGAPLDEMLQLVGLDEDGRIALQIWFDVDDMNAAVAELEARQARFEAKGEHSQRPENAANQVLESYLSHYAARDWHLMAPFLADEFSVDDRRHVVNLGVRRGRDKEIANLKAMAEIGCADITTTPVAVRGERLVLARHTFIAPDWPHLDVETIDVVEINADLNIVAEIIYDSTDLDAAIAEIDARYLRGEGAEYARTWTLIADTFAAANRHHLPPTTPNWVNIDHRRVTTIEAGELTHSFNAAFDVVPDLGVYVEAVHRLSDFGAVVTYTARGSSKGGFGAEWREIALMEVDGDKFCRNELFDGSDLEIALARFDELAEATTRLDNSASRIEARAGAHIAAGNWRALAEMLAGDVSIDDRRRVVNAGMRCGRDSVMEDLRVGADIGLTQITPTAIATRGEKLTLRHIRYSGDGHRDDAEVIDLIQIVEINVEEEIVALVLFDVDDLQHALAELEARYVEGEAAEYARTWSVIAANCAALNHQHLPAPPDFVYVDRRRVANIGAADVREFFHAAWELTPDMTTFVEAVHRLSDVGAVVTQVAQGNSRAGFYAEWRVVNLYVVDGDVLRRCEVFDETDLGAALAEFDRLERLPQPANTATRTYRRFLTHFAERDWNAMAEMVAPNNRHDDRRRVVNVGIQHGREAVVASMRAVAEVGVTVIEADFIATRGDRLALARQRVSGGDRPDAFGIEVLILAEVDNDSRVAGSVAFDIDDLDVAFAELDVRYRAGEAAAHADAYAVIAEAFAAVNRRELPVTTTDFVSVDHRRPVAFAPGEMMEYLQATLNDAPEIRIDIETVHRLSDLGAVISHRWQNTSQQGFDAEWRVISVSTVDGNRINRCELYDETDLDAALHRFDKLCSPARQLGNTASRVAGRFRECFADRDWSAMAEMLARDLYNEDRRPVVNAGIRYGRDSLLQDMRSAAEAGIPALNSTDLATRGERLVLVRAESSYETQPGAFYVESLAIAEIDADEVVTAQVIFGVDDADAAFQELEKRYIAGEAAAYAGTWSVISGAYAALNRHEIPPTTPNWVNIDHRRGGTTFSTGDLATYIRASWEDSPQNKIRVETVHRLSHLGAVVTSATRGVSVDGFYAEWRQVDLVTVDCEKLSRTELFDESDLEIALAKFDELSSPPERIENTASRVLERSRTCFAACDWDGMRANIAEHFTLDDRRSTVNGGISQGGDSLIRDVRTAAEVGFTGVAEDVIALRGERLILTQARYWREGEQPDAFFGEVLHVIEINTANKITTTTVFDPDDLDAAFADLDARYLAGEAAAHAPTYSLIADSFAAVNRRELPMTATEFVSIDHRRPIAFAPGEMMEYLQATLNDAPEIRLDIERVHRLSDLGVLFALRLRNTSQQGFDADWRVVGVSTVEGDRISRCEIYDEADLEAALARFNELTTPAAHFENAATRADAQSADAFNRRDLDGYLAAFGTNARYDDRRRGLQNAGPVDRQLAHGMLFTGAPSWRVEVVPVAIRGHDLALIRHICRDHSEAEYPVVAEVLALIEVTEGGLIGCSVLFDPDDIDAAFTELDASYLAGEGAAHAHMWALVVESYARFNRHETPVTTTDWVNVDHRRVTAFEPGDLTNYVQAAFSVTPDTRAYISAVHRLSNSGAVITASTYGTSPDGFHAEWRDIHLLTFEGDLGNRFELFDEEDVDAALARFDELSPEAPEVANTAARVLARVVDAFERRDPDRYLALFSEDCRYEDRRKGLRDDGVIKPDYAQTVTFGAAVGWQAEFETVAVRGEHLMLGRAKFRDKSEAGNPIAVEVLNLARIAEDESISWFVVFDPDDVDAAFEELDANYLAGEAAAYAHSWSVIAGAYRALSRRELPATTRDWVNIDHRRGTTVAPGEVTAFLHAALELTPQTYIFIEAVHRLSALGAVVTHVLSGTSHDGFEAEWRDIGLLAMEGELISRLEVFDEADLDVALARFDELSASVQTLENAATRGSAALADAFNCRDREGIMAVYGTDARYDDRRKGLRNAGLLSRDFGLGLFDFEATSTWRLNTIPIATRGNNLALIRHMYRDTAAAGRPVVVEALLLTDADDAGLIRRCVLFDPEDISDAFAELNATKQSPDSSN